ncbi:unnamed protein product [Durusdinium trenchii]|uniref:Magnesium transporter n=1 Tax=Durusdinium trenchii TaxID=1381693 RepID=A0ABP0I5X0_9DINO
MREDLEVYFWNHKFEHLQSLGAKEIDGISPRLLAPASAVASGVLHAWGMALRKHYGQGSPNCLFELGWWAGLLTDGLGGIVFASTAPLMAVEILVPLTAVAQLSAAFICGVCMFGERSTTKQKAGFVLSVSSVGLLGCSRTKSYSHLPGSFWKLWLQPHVLWVHLFWVCTTVMCLVGISEQTGFAVLSAYFDGMQFLFTRTLAMTLENAGVHESVASLSLGKAFCALTAIYWQQHSLGAGLISIGGVLPLLQNLTQASLGATFFRDEVEITPAIVSAMIIAPVSVWLLAQTPEVHRAYRGALRQAGQAVKDRECHSRNLPSLLVRKPGNISDDHSKQETGED